MTRARRILLAGLLVLGLVFVVPQPAAAATLQQLSEFLSGSTTGAGEVRAKVEIAAFDRATAIVDEATPSPERKAWAQSMLQSKPASLIDELFRYAVMTNDDLTIAQLLAVTDAQIQAVVDVAVDALYP